MNNIVTYKSFFGEDAFDKLISDITSESEYCRVLLQINFNKPLVITKKVIKILKIVLYASFLENSIKRRCQSKRSLSNYCKILRLSA